MVSTFVWFIHNFCWKKVQEIKETENAVKVILLKLGVWEFEPIITVFVYFLKRCANMCNGKWPRRAVNRSRGKLGSVDNVWWCSPGNSFSPWWADTHICATTCCPTLITKTLLIVLIYCANLKTWMMWKIMNAKHWTNLYSIFLHRFCLHPGLVLLGICPCCWFPLGVPSRATLASLVVLDISLWLIQVPGPGKNLYISFKMW